MEPTQINTTRTEYQGNENRAVVTYSDLTGVAVYFYYKGQRYLMRGDDNFKAKVVLYLASGGSPDDVVEKLQPEFA